MIEAFAASHIDVGVGLTEAWVAGMARNHAEHQKKNGLKSTQEWRRYHIASTYVESPLRWALSTGAGREDIQDVKGLRGGKVGISRLGSGSHIMSTVLADQRGWLEGQSKAKWKPKSKVDNEKEDDTATPATPSNPFEPVVCGPLPSLIEAVTTGTADFFMWERYTTKKHWDAGTLKRVGEIATPWNGWHIAVRGAHADPRLNYLLYPALARGIKHFREEKAEVIDWIVAELGYASDDAENWYKEVRYPNAVGRNNENGVEAAVDSLRKAGIIKSADFGVASVLSADEKRLV